MTNDVWTQETFEEAQASEELNCFVEDAMGGEVASQSFLEVLFNERWGNIKEKLETEGSVWYVWWMDGVRAFMQRS